MQTCNRCSVAQPFSAYRASSRHLHGRLLVCKKCLAEQSRHYYKENHARLRSQAAERYAKRSPEKIKVTREWRTANRMKRHGLTVGEYNETLTSQGNCCAICKRDEPGGKGGWHLDHDHKCCPGRWGCGKCFRGLLCHKCNIGLGYFNDDVSVMTKASDYLRKVGVAE